MLNVEYFEKYFVVKLFMVRQLRGMLLRMKSKITNMFQINGNRIIRKYFFSKLLNAVTYKVAKYLRIT